MNSQNILMHTAHLALVERAMNVLDGLEYRRVRSIEDLEPVIALRTKAYRAHNVYVDHGQPMTDGFDLDPRFFTFGVYWEERLVASLRIHIVTSETPACNSRDYFPEVLDPLIDQGLTFMDPTRFAIDPDVSFDAQAMPLVTLRLGFLAAKHFGTDFCLSMIKEKHKLFYRKVFRSTQMTPFQTFAAVHSQYALFSSPRSMEDVICQKFPIFRSTQTERNMLFGRTLPGQPPVLSVRPTARLAMRQRALIAGSLGKAV